jgi:hypothetical protein
MVGQKNYKLLKYLQQKLPSQESVPEGNHALAWCEVPLNPSPAVCELPPNPSSAVCEAPPNPDPALAASGYGLSHPRSEELAGRSQTEIEGYIL